jgi:hypothetical protein
MKKTNTRHLRNHRLSGWGRCLLHRPEWIFGNFLGTYSVDSGPHSPLVPALLINVGLMVLFGLPHSLMARLVDMGQPVPPVQAGPEAAKAAGGPGAAGTGSPGT